MVFFSPTPPFGCLHPRSQQQSATQPLDVVLQPLPAHKLFANNKPGLIAVTVKVKSMFSPLSSSPRFQNSLRSKPRFIEEQHTHTHTIKSTRSPARQICITLTWKRTKGLRSICQDLHGRTGSANTARAVSWKDLCGEMHKRIGI